MRPGEQYNAYLREWRAKRIIAGVCLDCRNQARPDNPRCVLHAEKHRKIQNRKTEKIQK